MGDRLDVLIVGGGITGLSFAALLADAGFSVVVIRRVDAPVPQAEALRNQAWLQSGYMYMRDVLRVFEHDIAEEIALTTAMQMYGAGDAVHRQFGLPAPYSTGQVPAILRVAGGQREAFLSNADLLREVDGGPVWADIQPASVELLQSAVGKQIAASLVSSAAVNFTLPDRPFDEARILTMLRNHAIAAGAEMYNSKLPVVASDDAGLYVGDTQLPQARITIIAAGLGTMKLLQGLQQADQYEIRQTPMLVADKHVDIRTPILVDLEKRFSLVNPPGDKCVIGSAVRDLPVEDCDSCDRSIPPDRVDDFLAGLPSYLRHHVDSVNYRFTAGRELIPKWEIECFETGKLCRDGNARMHLHNQIPYRVPNTDYWIVNPGRATTAFTYADQCIYNDDPESPYAAIANAMPRDSAGPYRSEIEVCSHLTIWESNDPIYMHYEGFYGTLDDRESPS